MMKPAAATAAIATSLLSISPVRAAAEESRDGAQFSREVMARAVAALPPVRQPATVSEAGDWSRVTALAPGREIIITVGVLTAVRRHVVAANASSITLIDLAHPQLPDHITRIGRDLLERSPELLARVADGGTFVRDRVRLAPEGIFLDDRRVGEIETLLQRVASAAVVEVRGAVPSSGGLTAAAMLLVPTGAVLHAKSGGWRRPEPENSAGTVVGAGLLVTGLVAGAVALKRGFSAAPSATIYRRP